MLATTKPGTKYRSIQNPRMYRALRKRGFSKTEAAKISNGRSPGHTVKANTENHTGVMVAFYPDMRYSRVLARRAAVASGEVSTAADIHCTICYLGKTDEIADQKQVIISALQSFAQSGVSPGSLATTGIERFDTTEDNGTNAVYAAIDPTPKLLAFRTALVVALSDSGVAVDTTHPDYTPHITLAYVPERDPLPPIRVPRLVIPITSIYLCWGDERISVPLSGVTVKGIRRITGNLGRDDTNGKFAAAGSAGASKKPKKLRKGRVAKPKKAPKAKVTPEQRQQARDAQKAKNRAAVQSAMKNGPNAEGWAALSALREGKDADPGMLEALSGETGLVEKDANGKYRLSPDGEHLVNAADRGDVGEANIAVSRGQDRLARQDAKSDRQTATAQRHADVEKRRQDRAAAVVARRQAAADAKKKKDEAKPKGGGGGGSKAPKGPSSQDKLDQQLAVLGQLVGRKTKEQSAVAPSSFAVFKDAKGQYRWLAQTSNGFEDRDKEIVSSKALAADVVRADKDKLYGPLRWWHIGDPDPLNPTEPWGSGFDLGMCDFNAMSGGVLIESGTFKSEAIAEWAASCADDLGLSPGFFHPESEPDSDGVFDHIRRFERSLAPEGRVSNPFTTFTTIKETRPMEATKIKELLDMGLAPDVVKQLMDGAAMTEKTAQQQGVRFKAKDPRLTQLEALETQITTLKSALIEAEEKAPIDPAAVTDDGETEEQEMAGGDLLDMSAADFADLVTTAVTAAIAPLAKALDVSTKVEGMLKGFGEEMKTLTGSASATATKTQKETEATQQELTTLKARIAEIEGGATAVQNGYRASADGNTVTEKARALHESDKPQPLTPIDETMAWVSKAAAASVNGQIAQ